jgi:hypothetical protein
VVTAVTRPASTFVGAFGTKPGITLAALDAGPVPMMLVAVTVIVTDTLFVSPLIEQLVPVAAHD